jgi:hypothetical protein
MLRSWKGGRSRSVPERGADDEDLGHGGSRDTDDHIGGRGSTYGALLGIAVIGSINNGMYLLELDSSTRFMITAAVLLMAVVIDSVSRSDHQLPAGILHRS